MKSFLEEYGFAILSAIVVIVLILMISPVGAVIRNSLTATVDQFDSVAVNAISSNKLDLSQLLDGEDDENIPQAGDTVAIMGSWWLYYAVYNYNPNSTPRDFACTPSGLSTIYKVENGMVYLVPIMDYPEDETFKDTYYVEIPTEFLTYFEDGYIPEGEDPDDLPFLADYGVDGGELVDYFGIWNPSPTGETGSVIFDYVYHDVDCFYD